MTTYQSHMTPAPSPYADRHDVEEFAAELSVSHLLCREMGHNWKPWSARWVAEERAFERALRCTRCRTKRWQTLSSAGAVLSSHYEYVDGYAARPGMGRIVGDGRDALRVESLRRALAESEDVSHVGEEFSGRASGQVAS